MSINAEYFIKGGFYNDLEIAERAGVLSSALEEKIVDYIRGSSLTVQHEVACLIGALRPRFKVLAASFCLADLNASIISTSTMSLEGHTHGPETPSSAMRYFNPSSVTLTMRNRSKFSRFGTTTEISQ